MIDARLAGHVLWTALIFAAVGLALATPAAAASIAEDAVSAPLSGGLSIVRTFLLVVHVGGLALGLGAALLLDLFLGRHLYGSPLQQSTLDLLHFGGKVVTVGLALLWISGIGFLVLYGIETPEKLANPKIWAKLSIVVVLTINGFALHHLALPRLERRVGRVVLREASCSSDTLILLAIGSISFVSWISAFLLGMVRELNGVVGWDVLLLGYLATATAALGTVYGAHCMICLLLERNVWQPLGQSRGLGSRQGASGNRQKRAANKHLGTQLQNGEPTGSTLAA